MKVREVSRNDHSGVVAVEGTLDVSTAPALKARLLALCDEGVSRLVVDLSPTSTIDSSGVTVLVAIYQHLQRRGAGAMAVVVGDEHTAQRFETAGIDRLLPIARTREEALRRLPG